jgi:Cof subfamily protein (haloacid dehalogenase superfamily)
MDAHLKAVITETYFKGGFVMIKHVFCDLDGTLCHDEKTISRVNRHAVLEAVQSGIGFSLATGRVYPAARHFHDMLELSSPIICLNGALVVDPISEETLFSRPVDKDSLRWIVKRLKEEDKYFHIYSRDSIFSEKNEKAMIHYDAHNQANGEKYRIGINHVDDIFSILDGPVEIYKLGFYFDDSDFFRELVKDIGGDDSLNTYTSAIDLQDVVARDVDKALGVRVITQLYELHKSEIMCIGDNQNDVAMIRTAGLGIAMNSSHEDLKEAADLIIDEGEDDGVAFALKAYAIGKCTI